MAELKLRNPMIVAADSEGLLLVARAQVRNLHAPAQLWTHDAGYHRAQNMQVWLKHRTGMHPVQPPVRWQRQAERIWSKVRAQLWPPIPDTGELG